MRDEWIEWHGGECPVKIGTLVDVIYRDGDQSSNQSAGVKGVNGVPSAEDWSHDGCCADIVAYRISLANDLLEALERLLAEYESEVHDTRDGTSGLADALAEVDYARAAIAKARGN